MRLASHSGEMVLVGGFVHPGIVVTSTPPDRHDGPVVPVPGERVVAEALGQTLEPLGDERLGPAQHPVDAVDEGLRVHALVSLPGRLATSFLSVAIARASVRNGSRRGPAESPRIALGAWHANCCLHAMTSLPHDTGERLARNLFLAAAGFTALFAALAVFFIHCT